MYERCGMESNANGVKCGVVKKMKINVLIGFGHLQKE